MIEKNLKFKEDKKALEILKVIFLKIN